MQLPRIELWGDEPRRWVRFSRLMWLSDMRAIRELAERAQESQIRALEYYESYVAILEPAIAEKSWDGPLGNITADDVDHIVRAWGAQTEDDAVDPTSGSPSTTTSSPGELPCRTPRRSRSRSGTRRSGSASAT